MLVAVKTAQASVAGTMFFAPCAADFEKQWIKRELEAQGVEAQGVEVEDVKEVQKGAGCVV
jgi:hypothetical protein